MALRIRLGRKLERVTDHPFVAEVGFRAGLTEREYWDRGRGIWVLKPNAVLAEDVLHVTSPENVILAVGDVTGISRHGDRFAVEGTLRPGDIRVGTAICVPHPSRNPVSYAPEEDDLWIGSRAHARAALAAALQGLAAGWVRDNGVTAVLIDRTGGWRTITGVWTDSTWYRDLGYVMHLALDELGDPEAVRDELPVLAKDRAACAELLSTFGEHDTTDALLAAWAHAEHSPADVS